MSKIGLKPQLNGHRRPTSREAGLRAGAGLNHQAVERAARELLVALGADLDDEGLRDTPRRMAAAYAELLTPEPFNLTTFPNDEGYDELVVVRDIPFQSLCMHHVLPFHGVAHVGYLPGERILGLSKLARVVELFARDLQLQEPLTTQVADCLQRELCPKGVRVVLEAEHACMALRGVQKPGSRTVTSALHGLVRDDPRTREEFLSLTGGRSRADEVLSTAAARASPSRAATVCSERRSRSRSARRSASRWLQLARDATRHGIGRDRTPDALWELTLSLRRAVPGSYAGPRRSVRPMRTRQTSGPCSR
jgi:GTP cyclohydrolase IA